MYVSWQVLNELYKGKASPTTDKGRMYASGGPSGAFHVKWHMIDDNTPVVDRFHVTFEKTSKKTYYRITTDGSFVYLGNRPTSGPITKDTAAQFAGGTPLTEYDDIAAVFLKNVNGQLAGKLREKSVDAVADDAAISKAFADQLELSEKKRTYSSKYFAFPDSAFTKVGLQKLGSNARSGKSLDWYEEVFAKLEGTALPSTPSPQSTQPATTPSSAVFAGTKVPLPTPTGYAVNSNGPITTYKPWNKPGGTTPTPSQSGAPKPWHTQSTAPQKKPWDK